jgi:hypothetical protein
MTLRSALKTLLVLALGLPLAQCVLFWVRGLVLSMGDAEGAAMAAHAATGCAAAWLISLAGLVIVLGIVVAREGPREK